MPLWNERVHADPPGQELGDERPILNIDALEACDLTYGPLKKLDHAHSVGAVQAPAGFRERDGAAGLTDRRAERAVLDRLPEAVAAGQSRVLVVRGEPGAGKTALLEYLARRAPGFRLLRVAGVEPEMELGFAGLHQLCAPLLDRLEALPVPQAAALRAAFGVSCWPPGRPPAVAPPRPRMRR